MAEPKRKVDDLVQIKDDFVSSFVDSGDELLDTVEKVKNGVFRIVRASGYWGTEAWYTIVHIDSPDEVAGVMEANESDLKAYRVRPVSKTEMAMIYKSLGVKV